MRWRPKLYKSAITAVCCHLGSHLPQAQRKYGTTQVGTEDVAGHGSNAIRLVEVCTEVMGQYVGGPSCTSLQFLQSAAI
jgi:hypothetical protein